jgi:hypothetical protein
MESLHPRIRLLWALRAVLAGLVLGAVLAAVDRLAFSLGPAVVAAVAAAVGTLGVVHALFRYRVWRFEVGDDSLYLVRGVLTRTDTSVPFVRVQHVDTRRGPLERAAGLSSVVVYTAGSRGADITIPGLRPSRATDLRERLRDLAVESEFEDAV